MFSPTAALFARNISAIKKIPWRLSQPQKQRHRRRLRRVDEVVSTVARALARLPSTTTTTTTTTTTSTPPTQQPQLIKSVQRWLDEMPTEAEMSPRDKYTVFSRYSKGYRKGIHKVPKWTRVSQRVNPAGF